MVAQVPQLSGLWHEDETMLQCEGRSIWFWEMIDEDTKFMVASHISNTRTFEDTVAIFKKGAEQSKVRPRAVFVDGSFVYSSAFNNVFYTHAKGHKTRISSESRNKSKRNKQHSRKTTWHTQRQNKANARTKSL